MKTIIAVAAALLAAFPVCAQQTSVDEYLEKAGTIVIAKCLSVGPVNILMRSDVRVEVLLVVKGNETLREMTVISQYAMVEGETYLLRTTATAQKGAKYFGIDSRNSVVPISASEKLDELKALSPRILILRTMNLRAYEIERQLSTLKYELDALDAVRKN